MTKTERYKVLVDARKKCTKCTACHDRGLINPGMDLKCGTFESGHIGPWTAWQGSLDADLMVVGQDWGRVTEFVEQGGRDCGGNPTNARLRRLLARIGIKTNPPGWPGNDRLYFTNAVLCLKQKPGQVKAGCFRDCVAKLLSLQIDLVAPRVVVTLGKDAYTAVMGFYNLRCEQTMEAAVRTVKHIGLRPSKLVPVFHPGVYGTLRRPEETQIEDWQRVQRALEPAPGTE